MLHVPEKILRASVQSNTDTELVGSPGDPVGEHSMILIVESLPGILMIVKQCQAPREGMNVGGITSATAS